MLSQNLIQGQHLKIYPQQLQMLQLFHLNSFELDQRIREELEENPLIEENTTSNEPEDHVYDDRDEELDDYKDWEEFDYEDYYDPYPAIPSKHDSLLSRYCSEDFQAGLSKCFKSEALEQLHVLNLSEEERHIGEFIVNSLTDDGFLEETVDSLIDDYMLKYARIVHKEAVEKMIALVKSFEPVGLASSCIQEYLLVQLRRMNNQPEEVKLAIIVVFECYEELKSGSLEQLCAKLNRDKDTVERVLKLLGKLKLKPVSLDSYEPSRLHTIIPEFVVSWQDGYLDVFLYREKSTSLRVNSHLKAKLDKIRKDRLGKGSNKELKKKLTAAEWFVNALRERECVMLRVMKTIADLQMEFFRTGDEMQLKPMILKTVAEKVGVDISTVSRITSNKYVQTPFGCILLKNLFNEGIANHDGEMVNVKKVQEALRELINKEDRNCPLTDSQLAKKLCARGLRISRRTVTKYRNEIEIPPVKLRHKPALIS